jgi:hypothetical protein
MIEDFRFALLQLPSWDFGHMGRIKFPIFLKERSRKHEVQRM